MNDITIENARIKGLYASVIKKFTLSYLDYGDFLWISCTKPPVLASGRILWVFFLFLFFFLEQFNKWTKYICHPKLNSFNSCPRSDEMCLCVSFPADDVADGSTASLPGMIFAINHLANIIHLLKWCDEQSGHNCFHTVLTSILRFLKGFYDNMDEDEVDCVCDEIADDFYQAPSGLRQHGRWKQSCEWVRKARGGLAKVQRENHPVLSLERTWYLGFSAAFNVTGH